jgi:membrane-bound serine protease (ClpP class)
MTVAGQDITTDADTRRALTATGIAFAVLVGGAIVALFVLPQAARFRGIALETRLSRDEHEGVEGDDADGQGAGERPNAKTGSEVIASEALDNLLGTSGVARSDLRPGGIAEIDGERIDVVSEGGYITAGTPVIVVKDEGYRRVVRAVDDSDWRQPDES